MTVIELLKYSLEIFPSVEKSLNLTNKLVTGEYHDIANLVNLETFAALQNRYFCLEPIYWLG